MMQERLNATDDEWKVIEPRLSKVMTLSNEAGAGGFGMMMGRGTGGMRGMRNRRPGEQNTTTAAEEELSEIQKATQELQQSLENESATSDEIKTKLLALRKAREKTKQELAKAQQELREILTIRQESQLVLLGTLE